MELRRKLRNVNSKYSFVKVILTKLEKWNKPVHLFPVFQKLHFISKLDFLVTTKVW